MQIFNCFLPPVNLVRTSSWAKDNDDKSFSFDDSAILIKRGLLVHGEQAPQGGRTLQQQWPQLHTDRGHVCSFQNALHVLCRL